MRLREMRKCMKNNKKTSKMTWFLEHRLIVFIILLVVVLPLLMIPGIYISQYQQNKPVLFEDKHAEAISINKLEHFNFEYNVSEFRESNDQNLGGYYKIKYTLTKKDTVNTISAVKLTFQMSTTWSRYDSKSSEQSVTLSSERTLQVAFNFNMDKNVIPFVKAGGPYLYARINYTETILNEPFNRVLYVKLPFDLVSHQTTIIPA